VWQATNQYSDRLVPPRPLAGSVGLRNLIEGATLLCFNFQTHELSRTRPYPVPDRPRGSSASARRVITTPLPMKGEPDGRSPRVPGTDVAHQLADGCRTSTDGGQLPWRRLVSTFLTRSGASLLSACGAYPCCARPAVQRRVHIQDVARSGLAKCAYGQLGEIRRSRSDPRPGG